MKALLLLVFLLAGLVSAGQDTIVRIDGARIISKVFEITPAEVRYKKWDNQEGPMYVENRSNIGQIRYSNGIVENLAPAVKNTPPEQGGDYYSGPVQQPKKEEYSFNGHRFYRHHSVIPERRMHAIMITSKDREIVGLVSKAKDARALQYVGFGSFVFGAGMLYYSLRSLVYGGYSQKAGAFRPHTGYLVTSAVCLVGTVACPIYAGHSKKKRNRYNREALRLYNERY